MKTYIQNIKRKDKNKGRVIAVIDGDTIKIGWSLCFDKDSIRQRVEKWMQNGQEVQMIVETVKTRDRFDSEQANALALGRAINQHAHSLKYSLKSSSPRTSELQERGIPHSCIEAIRQVVSDALRENPKCTNIVLFNTRQRVAKNKRNTAGIW